MLHHLESYQETSVPRPGFELPFLVLDGTLHHLESYQEIPVPHQGSNYPSWYWTWRYTTWNHPGNSWISPDSSHYTPGILQDRHTTWNKSPCRRWEVSTDSPRPPYISVAWITRKDTTTAGIEHTLPPGISQDTATPPRRCVSIKTFAVNGSNPFFVAVTFQNLYVKSSFKVVVLRYSFFFWYEW